MVYLQTFEANTPPKSSDQAYSLFICSLVQETGKLIFKIKGTGTFIWHLIQGPRRSIYRLFKQTYYMSSVWKSRYQGHNLSIISGSKVVFLQTFEAKTLYVYLLLDLVTMFILSLVQVPGKLVFPLFQGSRGCIYRLLQ